VIQREGEANGKQALEKRPLPRIAYSNFWKRATRKSSQKPHNGKNSIFSRKKWLLYPRGVRCHRGENNAVGSRYQKGLSWGKRGDGARSIYLLFQEKTPLDYVILRIRCSVQCLKKWTCKGSFIVVSAERLCEGEIIKKTVTTPGPG